MKLNIENRWALVTGASGGLGEAIACSLAKENVNIIWVARNTQKLETLCEQNTREFGNQHVPITADLSEAKGVEDMVARIREKGIEPSIVVNNVGGNLDLTDPLSSVEDWQQVFQFNLFNSIAINNAFIPSMQENRWGRICHVSSIASLENQGTPMYCAAKAALNAYVRSVGRYLSENNIIMTAVLPGAVFTEGGYWDTASKERPEHVSKYLRERMAIKRFGTPDEISDFVTFMVSEKASFAVGTSLLLDGGQGRVFFEG